jgi:type I restriction enzyme S subunit
MSNNLPEGWKKIKLGQLVAPAYGRGLAKGSRIAGQYPVYGSNGQIGTHNEPFTSAPCIVIGRKGSIGEVRFSDVPCCPIDTAYYIDKFPVNLVPDYLYYFLKNSNLRKLNRAAAIPSLLRPDLEALEIPLPLPEEQSRIVSRINECLDRIDEIKHLRDEAQDEAKALLESVRFSTFGAIDKVPEGWAEKRLDEIADVIYGISAAISGNRDSSLGTPIIRMANMSLDGKLGLSDLRYLSITEAQRKKFLLKRGDLLLNWRSGSPAHIGKTALFDEEGDFTCASFILRIRAYPDKCNNRYLRHVLNFMRERGYFVRRQRMQVNAKLNATEFSAFPIRIPLTIEEQEKIADQLDAAETTCDRIRSEYQSAATDGDLLQGAVLRKAFAGEL